MNIQIENTQDVLDFTLSQYGSVEAFFNLYAVNSGSSVIQNITQQLELGDIIQLNTFTTSAVINIGTSPGYFAPNKTAVVLNLQTVWDLALQYYGDLTQVFNIVQQNSFIGNILNSDMTGLIFNYVASQRPNSIVQHYQKNNMNLVTGLVVATTPAPSVGKSFNISFNLSFD